MLSANTYLNFSGNTEEAFNFYKSVFGGEFISLVRFREFPHNRMGVPESDLDKIAHLALPLGENNILMGSDNLEYNCKPLNVGNNFYISLEVETDHKADELFESLAGDGRIEMPMQKTEWAEKFGICEDRFGVQWMVMFTGVVQFPAPH